MIKSVKGVTMFLKNWVFLFALAIAASVGTQNLAQETEPLRTIVVIGEAQISATPDKAVITLGARHVAKSAGMRSGKLAKRLQRFSLGWRKWASSGPICKPRL